MYRSSFKIFIVFLFIIGFTNHVQLVAQSDQNKLSPDDWIEDLDFMVNIIKSNHVKPFKTVAEHTVDSLAQNIRINIKHYSENKIIAEMSKLTALFKWGHTRLTIPLNKDHLGLYFGHSREEEPNKTINKFSILPVRFVQFAEGIYIESATNSNTYLLGQKVTHINEVEIEDALNRIAQYVSYENESALTLLGPGYLSIAELLLVEGIIDRIDHVELGFENGETTQLKPLKYDDEVEWVDYLEHNDIIKPSWLKRSKGGIWNIVDKRNFWTEIDQFYWYSFDPESESLFIKINYLFHHPDLNIGAFMNNAMSAAEENKAKKIILDLRHNRGGASDINRAVKLALQRWNRISEFGNLFIITGRFTYSAAIILAQDLEKDFNAIFIGEELGGKPAHIGDSQRFKLPNSGLTFRISVKEHYDWTGLNDRSSIWLHYPTPLAFSDYSKGIDRAVELAKNYRNNDLATEVIEIYKNTNINVALLIFYHLHTDPISALKDHSNLAFSLAEYLYRNEKNKRYALALLEYNLEYYSTHIPTLLLQSEIYIDEGQLDSARKSLEKVLLIDPEHEKANRLLEKIEK